MGNCIPNKKLRDFELEINVMKTNHRAEIDQILGELVVLKHNSAAFAKSNFNDRRRSHNPYVFRTREEVDYI